MWTFADATPDRRLALAESLNRLHLARDTTGSRRQSLVHHALVGDLLSLAECLAEEVAK